MTIRQRRLRAVTLVSAAVLAAATGCSTRAPSGDTAAPAGGGAAGEVQTGRGIEGDTITLGVLTDLTGVFAALGKDITNSQTIYWDKVNAEGGVCDRFKVELDVKDHGYVTQQGVQLYSGMRSDVLALQHTIASPINTALEPQLIQDHMVNFPAAWAQSLTKNEQNAVVGATYEIEMINVLDYLMKQGKLKEGDKIGHIYFEGEYGAGGVAGSEYFAEKHGMEVVKRQIKSTDTDMTAAVTEFKAQGVAAIALTVAPGQTASAAGVAASQGLNVPIAGNNPVFAPGLLQGPAGPALKQNLYVASPVAPFDKEPELLAEYTAKYPGNPTLGVVFGAATANVMQQILENACEAGDLTPEGVTKAKTELGDVETGGLSVPLNFEVGESPSLQSYIFQAADVPGGAKSVEDLYQGEDAEGFTPAE